MTGIDRNTDCVTVAGIGGEEIIKILRDGFIPKSFVFQPMKNADALRGFLLENGCKLEVDDVFTDGKKYYFIIKGRVGKPDVYTRNELLYGRDSLANPVFYKYVKEETAKKKGYLAKKMSAESRITLARQIEEMEEVLKGEADRNFK